MTSIVAFAGHESASLVYHLAWRYAEMGFKVVAADPTPECRLTSLFLDEPSRQKLWTREGAAGTFSGAVLDSLEVEGNAVAVIHPIAVDLTLLAGHPGSGGIELLIGQLALSKLSDEIRSQHAIRVFAAARRVMQHAAATTASGVVLVALGAGLGAMGGTAALAADYLVISAATNAFSLGNLEHIGAELHALNTIRADLPKAATMLPAKLSPAGYVAQVTVDNSNETMAGIPVRYATYISGGAPARISLSNDPHCLGRVPHYPAIAQLARDARKPIFALTAADGALGSHAAAVTHARTTYTQLAERIAAATWRPTTETP